MGLFDFLKKKEKNVYVPLDEDTIKSNEIIKAQQQKITSLNVQLAKIIALEKEKRGKVDEKKKENEVNKKLKEQEQDLRAKRNGKVIKLGKFYRDLLKGRFDKRPIEITDKNDEVILGQFGDFGIMEGGKFCIIDKEGNLMSYGRSLNQILYKPDAFENMVKRGRFTIPMDKDGNWLEDIEYKEMPEPMDAEYDEETGQIKRIIWSKVKTSEVKKIIADKMEKINLLQSELEREEGVNIKLKSEIDDYKRAMKSLEKEADNNQSQYSKSIMRFQETQKRLADLHENITKLTELKATYENLIDRKDEVINRVIKQLELTGEPKVDRLRTQIFEEIERYKAILPEHVEIKQEAPKEVMPVAQPGDIIKR